METEPGFLIFFLFCFRERVTAPKDETDNQNNDFERRTAASVATTLESPPKSQQDGSDNVSTGAQNGPNKPNYSARSLLKSASISASKCIGVKPRQDLEVSVLMKINLLSLFMHLLMMALY